VNRYPVEDDYQPVTWIGRHPVHITLLLVVLHVAAMIGGVILLAFGGDAVFAQLGFSSRGVVRGDALWSPITYALLHPPNLWFALEMLMFYLFGREVERYVGRRRYLLLYGACVIVPPLVLAVLSPLFPAHLAGSSLLHLGIFLTFAMLYPTADVFFGLQARWVALTLAALALLQAMAARSPGDLVALPATVAAAWWILHSAGFSVLPERIRARPARKRTALRTPAPKKRVRAEEPAHDPEEVMDRLLEKIGKEGLSSLSASERRQLEQAREALLRKE